MTPAARRVCLLILDGWGLAPDGYPESDDATRVACTPIMDRLAGQYPSTRLACDGPAVGLPKGTIGNSEVGHFTIGAGRRVYQDMSRIDVAIESGEIFDNPVLEELVRTARDKGGALHLMGLLSDAGVHAHLRHLQALIAAVGRLGPVPVQLHLFADGRDSPPGHALDLVRDIESFVAEHPFVHVASVIGRYYAMDRDKRYERTELAWRSLVLGQGAVAKDAASALLDAQAEGQTDEFVTPRLIPGPGADFVPIRECDAVLFYNYRADRARQLTQALTDPGFKGFDRTGFGGAAMFAGLTEYEAAWNLPALFSPKKVERILGEEFSQAGVKQLRLAETEKYAHVTYFLNCGREEPFPGEKRILVPSPREVATYDLKPQMSAPEVAETFVREWTGGGYGLAVVNLANADMVGHTGSLEAAKLACEAVDACVARIVQAVRDSGGSLIVTADHGNAEEMRTADGGPMTAHTSNRVPCILVDDRFRGAGREGILRPGELADLAPTLLALAGLDKPAEMTGNSLMQATSTKADA